MQIVERFDNGSNNMACNDMSTVIVITANL